MPRRNRCYLSPYCTSDSPTDGNERYFCIPKVKVGPICEVTKKLSQKRRSLWLKILGLTEAETEGKDRVLVCSRHFVSGQPDYEMYEKSVDWVPTLNIPLPKIIIIPPPTEEHSYCQKSLPPIAYNWKTSVSGTNKRIIQRRSHRVTILKKKKEKAIEKATKAQQKAEAIAEKIREKRRKKKLIALKKAKKEEKIKRAKKETALLLQQAYKKNNKMQPEPMLNQIESINIPMPLNPPQSNLLLSNEDHLLKRTNEDSKKSDVLRSESITIGINGIVNKLPSTSDISVSPKITDDLPIDIRTKPTTELHHSEKDMDVASTNKVTSSSETITSKNEFLQQLMLSQIGQGPKRKLTQERIAPETRRSDALKRAAEPIKNTAKLPSKIFILRKDASDNTSRTVITLKSPGNAPFHPVQKNVEKIIKQIKPSSSAIPQQQTQMATNSPKVVSSTTPTIKQFAVSPLKILQPAAKIMIPRNGVAAKTPHNNTKPTPSANPPCRVVSKNTDVVNRVQVKEPEPVPREQILQSLRNVEAYIRELIRQKKVGSQETQARSLLQKLIENHQKNNIDTETLVPTAQIVEGNEEKEVKEVIDLTKDDCDYILPDAAPNKLCPACSCRNSIEEISFLRSELGKKSIELESCRNDLDSLKKELCEAKNFISNLSAQLQENTQALCSYLANSNQQAI